MKIDTEIPIPRMLFDSMLIGIDGNYQVITLFFPW